VLGEAYNSPFNHMYDIADGGGRFLVMRRAEDVTGAEPVVVALNWTDQLHRATSP
jgi:hypothetical protein